MSAVGDLLLASAREGRPRTGPRSVHFDVVQACNARCLMCWDHSPLLRQQHGPEWMAVRLEVERFERILDQLMAMGGLRDVLISGMGEPFVHPHIETLMDAVKRRGLSLTVMTNLVARAAEPDLVARADAALVSIHGASEESYLAVHPGWTTGHHRTLLDRLAALRGRGVRIKHVQVITKHCAMDLERMVDLAAETGAERITFKLASLRHGTEPCGIDEDQRRWLDEEGIPRAERVATEKRVVTNLPVLAMQVRAGGRRTAEPAAVGCYMGVVYARVLADETALYCCNARLRMGSLRENTFEELWTGRTWNAMRDRLRAGSFPAGCEQCGKLEQNVKLARKLARAEADPVAVGMATAHVERAQ